MVNQKNKNESKDRGRGQMGQSDDGEEKMWIDWKDKKISPRGRGEEENVQYDMILSLLK